ncbi:MAG: ECF transporter S component [Coriobacteriia bacterium]|nr:ECF transporter S component [Coriobacteriia bacterium]
MQTEKKTEAQPKWTARQLATMALFIALGAILAFVAIPIFPPAAAFGITYDPANIPAIVGGLAFGPAAGLTIGVLSAVVRGILGSDIVGAIMNIVAVIGFVLPCATIYNKNRTTTQLVIGLVVGCLVSVALIIPANLVVWPYFFKIPFDVTVTFVVPLMLPFNLLKAGLNGVLSMVLYKSLKSLLEG